MLNKPDAAWALPAAVDGCSGVVVGVSVGVLFDGAVEPLGCVGVFVPGLEAKAFIRGYDAPELETTANVFWRV